MPRLKKLVLTLAAILAAVYSLPGNARAQPCTTAAQCDDGNACTADTCRGTGTKSCVHTPIKGCNSAQVCLPAGLECTNSSQCADGNACTEDICDLTGKCQHVPVDCDDHITCTVDTCLAGGFCYHSPKDTQCPTGQICNADYWGQAPLGCVECGGNWDCDDGDPCTIDECSLTGHCQAKLLCKTGFECQIVDESDGYNYGYWDSYAKCVPSAPECVVDADCGTATFGCDSKGLYVVNQDCQAGTCVGVFGGYQQVCDDGNACTVDTCSPSGGCKNTTKSCDDGNSCTADSCGTNGICVNAQISGCTNLACVSNTDCTKFNPAPTCSDITHSAGTVFTCQAGQCKSTSTQATCGKNQVCVGGVGCTSNLPLDTTGSGWTMGGVCNGGATTISGSSVTCSLNQPIVLWTTNGTSWMPKGYGTPGSWCQNISAVKLTDPSTWQLSASVQLDFSMFKGISPAQVPGFQLTCSGGDPEMNRVPAL